MLPKINNKIKNVFVPETVLRLERLDIVSSDVPYTDLVFVSVVLSTAHAFVIYHVFCLSLGGAV